MKVALVDDECEIIDLLNRYFSKIAEEHNVNIETKGFQHPSELLHNFESFDLICLDISMPDMNGMDLAHEIRKRDEDVAIMFVTNMAQYALKGYEVHAIDFLVKPITYGDFVIKVKKVLRILERDSNEVITVKTGKGTVYVKYSQICYIEVMKHDIIYHTKEKTYRTRGSMVKIEQILPNSFVRSSNSFLVNLKYVSEIKYNMVKVNEEIVPLTRTRRVNFMESLTRYIGGIK